MNKKKIFIYIFISIVSLIIMIVGIVFSLIKYKEYTWRDKIKVGISERKIYDILPIKRGSCNLSFGRSKIGNFLLTDGTNLMLYFQIPEEADKKDMVNGYWDVSMSNYVLIKYEIR